ncbi:hypothetical protein ACIP5Y_30365 [Nocardia sp. NPDC088792]|uniref:hypothetical protein n=1 Tax=Nocardia sp. NPDC088792 TaxID=3364332 RepID=UPI0038004A30
MQSDVPGAANATAMLKSYKKVSRWYPALEPAGDAGPAQALGDTVFDADGGRSGYPHYIPEEELEPELDIPPVPDAVLRRGHFNGAWSDWMSDRESASYAPGPGYRDATVVEFPCESDETGADVEAEQLVVTHNRPAESRDRTAEPRKRPAERRKRPAADRDRPAADRDRPAEQRNRPADQADRPTDRASELLDAVTDSESAPHDRSTAKRLFAMAFLIIAILLLAVAGGVALYVLNNHGGTAQSTGTLEGHAGSGPSYRLAAYNEMTATVAIGDHIPAAGSPAG